MASGGAKRWSPTEKCREILPFYEKVRSISGSCDFRMAFPEWAIPEGTPSHMTIPAATAFVLPNYRHRPYPRVRREIAVTWSYTVVLGLVGVVWFLHWTPSKVGETFSRAATDAAYAMNGPIGEWNLSRPPPSHLHQNRRPWEVTV